MDTSETYIKMCDCEEIQDDWNPEGLDFTHRRPGRQYKHGTMLWLPRQDQLQEMVNKSLFDLVYEFGQVLTDTQTKRYVYAGDITSMEQLWLAFVMKEKYNKTWDGDIWLIT